MRRPVSFDFWDKAVGALGYLVTGACLFWVAGVLGYQVFMWLKYGQWFPMPTASLLEFFDIPLGFVYAPTSWHGLAKIAEWILDLSMAITVPCLVLFLYAQLFVAVREK